MTSPPELPLGATVQEGSYAQCFSGQIRQSIAVSTPQKWRMPILSINGEHRGYGERPNDAHDDHDAFSIESPVSPI